MKSNAYMDPVGTGRYKVGITQAPGLDLVVTHRTLFAISSLHAQARIYLDEWSGAVLGANVMQDHEVTQPARPLVT